MDCSFCDKKIERGTDYTYVTAKGRALHFCSSKCVKNMLKLKRKQRKVRWTESYREEKEIRVKSSQKTPQKKEELKEKEKEPVEAEPSAEEKPQAKPKKKAKTTKTKKTKTVKKK